jgi:hypothetical protein
MFVIASLPARRRRSKIQPCGARGVVVRKALASGSLLPERLIATTAYIALKKLLQHRN